MPAGIWCQNDVVSTSMRCHIDVNTTPSPCHMPAGCFYAPNFEEVEGAYWFGPVRLSVWPSVRLSVCPSVRLSVTPYVGCKTREPLELGTWNFIYSISTKNKRTRIFFFFGRPLYGKVMPLFQLSHKNLVNTITWERVELGFSYLAYGLGSMLRWPD